VAARAQLVEATRAGKGVDQAEEALATALELQKVTKEGKGRGGALFLGVEGHRAQQLCTIPAASVQLPRAPPPAVFQRTCRSTPPRPNLTQNTLRALPAGLAANTAAALEAKREAQALAPPRPPTARQLVEMGFAERALAAMAERRAHGR